MSRNLPIISNQSCVEGLLLTKSKNDLKSKLSLRDLRLFSKSGKTLFKVWRLVAILN
jgi:hypothetical protein